MAETEEKHDIISYEYKKSLLKCRIMFSFKILTASGCGVWLEVEAPAFTALEG